MRYPWWAEADVAEKIQESGVLSEGWGLSCFAHAQPAVTEFSLSFMYCLEDTDRFLVNHIKGNSKPGANHFSKSCSHLSAAAFQMQEENVFTCASKACYIN